MRSVVVARAGAEPELVERDRPEPRRGEGLLRVKACGVCHSAVTVRDVHVPDTRFPTVPGHEVVGVVEEVGPGVDAGGPDPAGELRAWGGADVVLATAPSVEAMSGAADGRPR